MSYRGGSRRRGFVFLFAASLVACETEPAPLPARIILFSMDTVRADRISGYSDVDTAPALRQIAEEGALFRNFYAASSYTIPSHASIFTGLDPAEHQMTSVHARIAPEVPTLPEMLRESGYRTQAFHEGVYVAGRFGFERGFDTYQEFPRLSVVSERLPEILDWMRATADDPYFLFLHTYATHLPYGGFDRYRREHPERGLPDEHEMEALREEYRGSHLGEVPAAKRLSVVFYNQLAEDPRDLIAMGYNSFTWNKLRFMESEHFEMDVAAMKRGYDERIHRIDRAIARIRETLVELGQWEDTLLIALSDHGEAFFEHELEKHSFVPFDEVFRVPLIISFPRLFEGRAPGAVDGLAWHLDVAPTILGLAGIQPPAGLQGVNLTPAMMGDRNALAERAVFPAVLRPPHLPVLPLRRIVIRDGMKWIEGHDYFGDAEGFLFDLKTDPLESHNLRDERKEAFQQLARTALVYAAGLRPHPPVHQKTGEILEDRFQIDLDLSADELEKLRVLGYVDDDTVAR